jgi:hypothetical protein
MEEVNVQRLELSDYRYISRTITHALATFLSQTIVIDNHKAKDLHPTFDHHTHLILIHRLLLYRSI